MPAIKLQPVDMSMQNIILVFLLNGVLLSLGVETPAEDIQHSWNSKGKVQEEFGIQRLLFEKTRYKRSLTFVKSEMRHC